MQGVALSSDFKQCHTLLDVSGDLVEIEVAGIDVPCSRVENKQ